MNAYAETENFSFDALGRLTDDRSGSRTLAYDNAGRLSAVVENGELIASYRYNYRGERIAKTLYSGGSPVQTVHYHYDLNGQLLAETASNGSAIRDYVWIDNQPVAQIAGTQTIYLVTDHLNTPRRALNANGAVVWRWSSDAYGYGAAEQDVDGDSVNVSVNLRLRGQYFDQETGRYYNYFRDYDPTMGRYIESDPIGLEGGLNTYLYANANPLRFTDPLGLDAIYVHYNGYPVNTGYGFNLPLGHAAVIGVNPNTGGTRYYEFGRYDKAQKGDVVRRWVPDVKMGSDGRPTPESLQKLYDFV